MGMLNSFYILKLVRTEYYVYLKIETMQNFFLREEG